MTDTVSTRIPAVLRCRNLILAFLGLILIQLFASTRPISAAEPSTVNQCVTCHTDSAKLKALTPPDPPASEAGEG